MKTRLGSGTSGAPKHLDRPRQWAQAPWLLLGMVFFTALLIASQRVASLESYDGAFQEPTSEISNPTR